MQTKMIPPQALDPLATSPQCLDNQFVPHKIFQRISKKKTTLKDITDRIMLEYGGDPFIGPKDKDAKVLLTTVKTEYNRALIYSKQVVANRNAFWNAPTLIVSELSNDVEHLAVLIEQGVVVPYLFEESSFDQPPARFDTSLGEKAMKRLCERLSGSQVQCVRLSADDVQNKEQIKTFSSRFLGEFTRLLSYEERDTIDRLTQILLPENAKPAIIEGIKQNILEVAKWIEETKRNQIVRRENIYQQYIVVPDTLTSYGIYRADPFTFELKKWVDSIYNSNLPDALGILTFVPEGFPTAYDLGMAWALGRKAKRQHTGTDMIEEVVDRARSHATWKMWEAYQKSASLVLPSPEQLTHADILEIRQLNAWYNMMSALDKFINPVSGEGKFEYTYYAHEMWEAFRDFNQALGSWYLKKSEGQRLLKATKYAVAIGRIYQWGEWMIGLLFGKDNTIFPVLPPKGVQPPPLEQEDIRFGIEAGLFLVTKAGIDWRRSQLIQKMDRELVVKTDEVKQMIDQIVRLFPETAPYLKPTLSAEMQG
jgi:hypothetical protein